MNNDEAPPNIPPSRTPLSPTHRETLFEPPVTEAASPGDATRRGLEKLRKKLLDLTSRNTLLNYRHPKAAVRIVDELPDQIAAELLAGKAMTFLPVPAPSDKELIDAGYRVLDPTTGSLTVVDDPTPEKWARHLRIQTSFELPSGEGISAKHQDDKIQTLLFADSLEARLRSVRSKADTAIAETGSNILYLAVGFLEWCESSDSDQKRLAPLYTIPVRLTKDQLDVSAGVFRYKITLKDEDVLDNITLREKLANDFGLILPAISDALEPEAFLESVSRTIIQHKPSWKIHRYITLATLNFRKQSMYHDLDPDRWPESSSIHLHPTVQRFFRSEEEPEPDNDASNLDGFLDEYKIDDITDVHTEYPLILDADSSQHSALIDALKGNDLVIEGPPGTGKSQTITNIIAASMANGKTVLFVAEKMAALNVVKARLDQAGLGGFCLELHSHLTDKTRVLASLESRLNDDYQSPAGFSREIEVLKGLQVKLSKYATRINECWKETGLTCHRILTGAVQYREKLKLSPGELDINWISGDTYTPYAEIELTENAKRLAKVHQNAAEQALDGEITSHYWYGVKKTDLVGEEIRILGTNLETWNRTLGALNTAMGDFGSRLNIPHRDRTLHEIKDLLAALKDLPELAGGEALAHIAVLGSEVDKVFAVLTEYESCCEDQEALLKSVTQRGLHEPATLASFSQFARALGLNDETTVEEIADLNRRVLKLKKLSVEIETAFSEIRDRVPVELTPCLQPARSGWGEFRQLVTLIRALPTDLWRHRSQVFDDPDVDSILEILRERLGTLTTLAAELESYFDLQRLPSAVEIRACNEVVSQGGLFRWFSSQWRKNRSQALSYTAPTRPSHKSALRLLPQFVQYVEGVEAIEAANRSNPVLQELYAGVETPIKRLCQLRNWYRNVRSEYGRGFDQRSSIGTAILNLDRDLAIAIETSKGGKLDKLVQEATIQLEALADQIPERRGALYKDPLATIDEAGVLASLQTELSKHLDGVGALIQTSRISIAALHTISESIPVVIKKSEAWKSTSEQKLLAQIGFTLSLDPGQKSDQVLLEARATLAIARKVRDFPDLQSAISGTPTAIHYRELHEAPAMIEQFVAQAEQAEAAFSKSGAVDLAEWSRASSMRIKQLMARNSRALTKPDWLVTWIDYLRVKEELIPQGLGPIVERLENRDIASGALEDVVRCVAYHQLSKEIMQEDPIIAACTAIVQDSLRERFSECDRQMLALQRKQIAATIAQRTPPTGTSGGQVGSLTELSLLKHEIGKKRRHVALRDLAKRSGATLRALKPCFMMSPMSVARYLEPGINKFDIVIMDEASQIRPEDALGAIARGQNLVVVGDPKQLPPTQFFDALLDEGETTDETTTIEGSESILDVVSPMFKNRRLRWHYRSRHESLIAFSNKEFYHSDLVVFPSPFQKSDGFGVRRHWVSNGCFVDKHNIAEAAKLVDFLVNQLLTNPSETVGVVAMNIVQRDYLEQEFERRSKEDEELRRLAQERDQHAEPLFFKNLENVQGDERDVIIISMTYGPQEPGGAVPQRFGPINQAGGWRRLNVLFTRAKKRMHIFTSMTATSIQLGERASRGKIALQGFLAFCEGEAEVGGTITGREPDTDFEVAVKRALAGHGFDCEPQVGVAGYYLDLAVRDPHDSGHFLMGIECDGATYHSAKSARDRDRLRQEVLEGLGWKIRRIWSTDWFKNPEAQLQPIVNELRSLTNGAGAGRPASPGS